MKKIYILPAALLTIGLTAPAFADDTTIKAKSETTIKKDEDGSYKKKQTNSEKVTDSAGTTTTSETKVKVESDADGDAKKEVTTETTSDPKGLMNKTKTVATDSVTYKDGKVETKHKKKIDGKVVEEHVEEAAPASR